ncbi:hypothetical protein INT45_004108 [Circinella minor]|uniref:DNA replication complex GINS protein SLD5 n=1 Tax=Circinella minor TaxID=1195481 RepID=A0A8H7RZ54_9FUNG|nr:hypothetical protein INT45_004108 [Circinella minor]KAI7855970.1 hypothetical protein BDC45DRAFT_505197 [Circinella umbellata]
MLGDDPSSLSLSSSFNEFNNSSLQDTQVFENVSFVDGLLESGETIKELTNAWMNERNSPELLTYKGYLVNELVEQLDYQVNRILETPMTSHQDKLNSMLYQNEIERIKFIIKSYLRTRLHKIEQCTLDLLRNQDIEELMSEKELIYARNYQKLVEQHNHDSFLHTLPERQHKQDERSGDLNMVVTSNLEAPVFIKVLENSGNVQLARDEMVMFEKDDIFILRYADIRSLLLSGAVRLL